MKRLLLVAAFGAAVVLAVLLASSQPASANNGPHGGYSAITDACAGCHQGHTAVGPYLLREADTYTLCMTCHGNSATGAVTNVSDGVLEVVPGSNVGTPLNGGGFDFYQGAATTSIHDPTGVETDAWGNDPGATRGVLQPLAAGEQMDCASCHDPHGSSNYRIIREVINGNAVVVTQVDEGAWVYDAESWPADISNVCAACHVAYHETNADVGSDNTAWTYPGGYTHRIDMPYNYGGNNNPETVGMGGFFLPLGDSGVTNIVVCNTCHLSHGSSAAMTGFADGGPGGAGTLPGDTSAGDSALLRLDDRGTCEVCHQK